jgi:hypothetical protein
MDASLDLDAHGERAMVVLPVRYAATAFEGRGYATILTIR